MNVLFSLSLRILSCIIMNNSFVGIPTYMQEGTVVSKLIPINFLYSIINVYFSLLYSVFWGALFLLWILLRQVCTNCKHALCHSSPPVRLTVGPKLPAPQDCNLPHRLFVSCSEHMYRIQNSHPVKIITYRRMLSSPQAGWGPSSSWEFAQSDHEHRILEYDEYWQFV